MATTTGHVTGTTCHYDVNDLAFLANRRGHYDVNDLAFCAERRCRAAWQQTQNDVIMTSRFYHVTSNSSQFKCPEQRKQLRNDSTQKPWPDI